MTTSYALVDTKVNETITIPESTQVKDLGDKDSALAKLTTEIAKAQSIIDIYTANKAALQTKLDAINAL